VLTVAQEAFQQKEAKRMSDEEETPSRRNAMTLFAGALGIGLVSCVQNEEPRLGTETQAANGSVLRWVDTVLGGSPNGARTGDLATKTSANLGNAIMALAKGCVSAGDGGGGLFYWDAAGGTDNGGTVIVPNATVGSTGPCWRRFNR